MTIYTVRSFKSLRSRPNQEWSNTYEFDVAGTLEYQSAKALAYAVANMEQLIHLNFVEFVRATVSTFQPDSRPYNPANLFTFDYNYNGQLPGSELEQESLDTVLWVKRIASSGRNGKLFYRGCILDSQVFSPQGDKRLDTPSALLLADKVDQMLAVVQAAFEGATMVMAGTSLTGRIYNAALFGVKQLVTKTRSPALYVRPVNQLSLGGVKTLDVRFSQSEA